MRNRVHLTISFVIVLLLGFHVVRGQQPGTVSGEFHGIPFSALAKAAGEQSGMRFYFDPAEADSLVVDISANRLSVDELLSRVFRNTDWKYAITPEGDVFITKRIALQTALPAGFFSGKKPANDTIARPGDYLTGEAGSASGAEAGLENRLFEIGKKAIQGNRISANMAGYIRDRLTGEAIVHATVFVDTPSVAVVTDQFGYYSINLPPGRHTIRISSTGMKETKREVQLYSDGNLNVNMETFIPSLKAVIVSAERRSNIRSLQMGLERLTMRKIKQVPVVMGEADLLRVVLTLPGVSSVGEASTGFNVRGGSADQNLILFNDATIYNPSHLFGFFSSFNPDIVKNVELYKSAIPEKYGGRLSSVLDVTSREGNNKKFSGSGGIGSLTSRLVLEGPLSKDKTTFLAGGRTTYSNWILRTLPNESYRSSRASFYDLNLHINHSNSTTNNLFLTAYMSGDRFRLNNDTVYRYRNMNVNLKWKHHFNNQFIHVLTGGYDHYEYSVSASENKVNAFRLQFDIRQLYLRSDFTYALNNRHNLNFGINSIRYDLQPGTFNPNSDQSLVTPDKVQREQAFESAVYAGDRFDITDALSVSAGLRYSLYQFLGPRDVYQYAPGVPRSMDNLTDTVSYGKGKNIAHYGGPEYRVSLRYSLSENSSFKASYNTLRQYIHLLSNTAAISPTDVWKLSDPYIRPQTGDQFSIGFYRNFKSNTIETSVELYYKRLKNALDYKSGATIVMNKHIETEVFTTRGKAYGAELLVRKMTGRLNGWFSYTWSRSLLQQHDPLAGEEINGGDYYPANYDKPHSINLVSNYQFSHRYSISFNLVYSTGRPITIPIAMFTLGNSQRVLYSDRNAYRIPDYFRADLSLNMEGNHKIKKATHNSWSFGVYNLTARQNAFSIYFIQQDGQIKGYKLSIFGTAIPYITYNIRF